jgi:hypothetical protein
VRYGAPNPINQSTSDFIEDMNFLCRCLTANDLLEKSHELRAGMAGRSFTQDFTTLGVERRKERKRPVPIIFKTMPLCAKKPKPKPNFCV